MKRKFFAFFQLILCSAFIFGTFSCEKDPVVVNPSENITISNLSCSHSDVTFEYSVPEDALVIGAVCVAKANKDSINNDYIFKEGKTSSKTTGKFTFTNLKSETEYLVFVAYRGTTGIYGPANKEFKTAENSGAPSTPYSAGVRVVTKSTDEIVLEVINGDSIDFSLVMIDHYIAMDNGYLNYTNFGGTGKKEDYVRGFMSETSNGYLMFNTPGAGETAILNYAERYSWPVYPDTDYSVFAFGCKGDWGTDSLEVLDFTEIRFTTDGTALIGDPFVDVETTKQSYDFFAHQITPNADAAYWATFISTTDEIDYFINHYDEKEGKGAGARRFNEFMRDYHKHLIPEQTQSEERRLNVGLKAQHLKFGRYAVGFDENFMMGERYDLAECQTKEIPSGSEYDAKYTMESYQPGATSVRIKTELEANCARVFWDVKIKGSFDKALSDYSSSEELKMALYDAGYAVTRPYGTPQPEADAPAEMFYDLHYGLLPNTEYEIVSTALNYTAGLTTPKITGTFTTDEMTFPAAGEYIPEITITADQIGKTQVIARYVMSEEGIEKATNNTEDEPRLIYHRIFDKSSTHETDLAILNKTDDEMREFLIGEGGNLWTAVSNDESDENKYDYYWPWAAMSPNTPYLYCWVVENAEGEISDLGKCNFRTLSNTGGDNPKVEITITPEDITTLEHDEDKLNMEFITTPNADVTYYNALWYSEDALKSYFYDLSSDEAIANSLLDIALGTEQAEYVEKQKIDVQGAKEESVGWLVVLSYGANGKIGPMSYVHVDCTSDEPIIGEQVDVTREEEPKSAAQRMSASKSGTPYYSIVNQLEAKAKLQREVLRKINMETSMQTQRPKRSIQEINAELKSIGWKTMGELSIEMLRSKGREDLRDEQ